jgi:hypothetical protein
MALFTVAGAVSGLLYRRRCAARRVDMGTVSAHWLAQINREHEH